MAPSTTAVVVFVAVAVMEAGVDLVLDLSFVLPLGRPWGRFAGLNSEVCVEFTEFELLAVLFIAEKVGFEELKESVV